MTTATSPAVTQPPSQPSPVSTGIPAFEGATVKEVKLSISGTAAVDTYDDTIVSIDDRVRIVGEYRCVGVRFKVDDKTGETIREQILRPIELQICPWDASDPNDNGIVRARP